MIKTLRLELPIFLKLIGWIYNNPNMFMLEASKRIDVTYSHLCSIKDKLVLNGWLNIQKEGRANIMNLTEKGNKIAEAYLFLEQEIGEIK